jgi:hypothetical protein
MRSAWAGGPLSITRSDRWGSLCRRASLLHAHVLGAAGVYKGACIRWFLPFYGVRGLDERGPGEESFHITHGTQRLSYTALGETILCVAGVNVKIQEFAAAIIVLIEDQDAVHRASGRDLAVLEGVLTVILDDVVAELQRRDQQQGRSS